MIDPSSLAAPGEFHVGCNYWASHAGTQTWSDWRPEVVEQDFIKLSRAGLRLIRVFPLWPDFQPLTVLSPGPWSQPLFAHGERQLSQEEIRRGGVSEVMMERFGLFIQMAERHGLSLVVGLVTGWMSGRLFVPPAFTGMNVITDPVALQWQVRFVAEFVRRFRGRQGVVAWDLGNECNVMAGPTTQAQAWVWASSLVNAIRAQDPSRPVISGMHSLSPAPHAVWTIQDQAELTDVLTVHPYPAFTAHAGLDPIDTPRAILHSTAEARLYADIGSKPCMIEEFGTLGPNYGGPEQAARYMRSVLWAGWAHDCHAALWWCGFDQSRLEQAPYDWCACERELGLFDAAGEPKPVLREMSRFAEFLDKLPVHRLPPRLTDAVCILTADQDAWSVAYPSFMLAKQAGFDLEFQYHNQPLKEADCYLLPSISSLNVIGRRQWLALLERVHAGATLYMSMDTGMVSPFTEPFGVTILTRERRPEGLTTVEMQWKNEPDLRLDATWKLRIRPDHAAVVAREADGNPMLTTAEYGRGRLVLLTVPLEARLADKAGALLDQAQPLWHIYRWLAQPQIQRRVVRKRSAQVGLTEHVLNEGTRIVVAQNYMPEALVEPLELSGGWRFGKPWHGPEPVLKDGAWWCRLEANDACVLIIEKM